VNLDLTSHGSLKLGVPWGSIRLSLRPYGPAGSSQFCTIVICSFAFKGCVSDRGGYRSLTT
jgi:hypothetical protein